MKKTSIGLLLATSLFLVQAPLETYASTTTAATEMATVIKGRKKNKRYKKKRGGLFNTGLFRKKNSCGCPNH